MTMLSDVSIRAAVKSGSLGIHPFNDDNVQPASVDVTLADTFQRFAHEQWSEPAAPIDTRNISPHMFRATKLGPSNPFVLRPGAFALASTVEVLRIPDHLVARVEGKSSLARLGLVIHATAGFIDPGFQGTVTLELTNFAPTSILLYPGMLIGQLSFQLLDRSAERPYGSAGLDSKYQGQRGATASRYRGAVPRPSKDA